MPQTAVMASISRRIEWMLVGVFLLIVVVGFQSYLVPRQAARNARLDCMQTTEVRVRAARRAASDWQRESKLANTAGEHARPEHARSATEAQSQARSLLKLSGVPSGIDPFVMLELDPLAPDVARERSAFCSDLYKLPGLFGI